MEFLDKKIQDYSESHTAPHSELLARIDRETNLYVLRPRMLSGHVQGRILAMFSHMIKPNSILEIGTYTGYSALCLAEGMQEDGHLITIDINEELEDRVKGYFSASSFGDRIDYRIGHALEVIPQLTSQFDLVFIDADKTNYDNYFELVIGKVSKGGFIIADNVLWSGKVLEEPKLSDKDTCALIEFNDKVRKDNRVESVLMPVRDGLMILRVL